MLMKALCRNFIIYNPLFGCDQNNSEESPESALEDKIAGYICTKASISCNFTSMLILYCESSAQGTMPQVYFTAVLCETAE